MIPWIFWVVGFVLFIASFAGEPDDDIAFFFSVCSFLIGGYYWLKNKTIEMVVTNRRVIDKKGIIAVHMGELRNVKVESIRLHQSIFGRILGYGSIELTGTGNTFVVFEYVKNPAKVMSRIKNIVDATKDSVSVDRATTDSTDL